MAATVGVLAASACGEAPPSGRGSGCAGAAVVFTELWPAPSRGDPLGEWLELANVGAAPVALGEVTLEVAAVGRPPRRHRLPAVWLEAGTALAVGPALATAAGTQPLPALRLADRGAAVALRCGDRVLDAVGYGDGGGLPAAPRGVGLRRGAADHAWCLTAATGATPGAPNPACAAPPRRGQVALHGAGPGGPGRAQGWATLALDAATELAGVTLVQGSGRSARRWRLAVGLVAAGRVAVALQRGDAPPPPPPWVPAAGSRQLAAAGGDLALVDAAGHCLDVLAAAAFAPAGR